MFEDFFAEFQRENCWFEFCYFANLPNINPEENVFEESWEDDILVQRHIFALLFGAYGYSQDLDRAKDLAYKKMLELYESRPQSNYVHDEEFAQWMNLYAKYNVLYGTACAYLGDYVLGAVSLLNALKSNCISLFKPYCDFINYILTKLEDIPAELVEYKGRGFSPDDPMGGVERDGGALNARAAELVIPSLQGDKGEFILGHIGRNRYSTLRRLGSTNSKNFRNCIDIYEILMVQDHKLKKLRLYFNGYFTLENKEEILLPHGFSINPASSAARYYRGIGE